MVSDYFYSALLYFIIALKVFVIILLISTKLMDKLDMKGKNYNKMTMLATRSDFIFVMLMSLLLIYLFNPFWSNKTIYYEGLDESNQLANIELDPLTNKLLFFLGMILIFTANWSVLIPGA